jgi:uncharacterized membrane protein YdjX (TVP38/TMEM64 family)
LENDIREDRAGNFSSRMKLDKKELAAKAAIYGKQGAGFAVKAAIVYVVTFALGLIGGATGAYYGAAHFGYGGWWGALASIIGLAAGGVAGFFAGKIAIVGMVEDMVWSAKYKAGKAGYEKSKELVEELRKKPAPAEHSERDGNSGS